ncbi:hypothetical protein H310_02134 [Aphanomyces invadans]|uniref:Nudix hydrolase domain-containing protein n=1 Tax=Aphanomyces invadans TaxID=157072 RepID=A0A024UMJ1_9STRA|nr:hypothetical protein H310_02134 [Aphanomyces invadans]ETW07676.1 hypothetical protein H310_02134 [Aphanomyces invadans]|eukprot:XP_008863769.1 hypothetical protein H310_02134 [Aphanomyces invadans]
MVALDELEAAMKRHASKRPALQLSGTRTASVAAIFAPNGEANDSLEVLFIRRAINPRDRWSGHIAFPGGRVEAGESPLDAARRETMEEIGVNLNQAAVLGQLDDRLATRNGLVVSTFVFFLLAKPTTMALQPNEVSDVLWVPYSILVSTPRRELRYSVGTYLGRFVPRIFRATLATIPLGTITFPCLYLPSPSAEFPMSHDREAHEYVLWGVTYSMFLDLQTIMSGDRDAVGSAKPSLAGLYHRIILILVSLIAVALHSRAMSA